MMKKTSRVKPSEKPESDSWSGSGLGIFKKKKERKYSPPSSPRGYSNGSWTTSSINSTQFCGEIYVMGIFYLSHKLDIKNFQKDLVKKKKNVDLMEYLHQNRPEHKWPATMKSFETVVHVSVLPNNLTQVACSYNTIVATDNTTIYMSGAVGLPPSCLAVKSKESDASEHSNFPFSVISGIDHQIRAVAPAAKHTLVLTTNHKIFLWGKNPTADLGVSPAPTELVWDKSSLPWLSVDEAFASVDAGIAHNVLLSAKGIVYTWGSDQKGQLGRKGSRNLPIPIPYMVEIIQIACGLEHTLALDRRRGVWAWGSNNHGQVGMDLSKKSASEPTQIIQLENIYQIGCGSYHCAALGFSGTQAPELFTWGKNKYGQLGIGSVGNFSDRYLPCVVNFSDGLFLKKVSCGKNTTAIITAMGTVYIWGQLAAKGMSAHQSSPRLLDQLYSKHLFIGDIASGTTHHAFLADRKLSDATKELIAICKETDMKYDYVKSLLLSIPTDIIKPLQDRALGWVFENQPDLPAVGVDESVFEWNPTDLKGMKGWIKKSVTMDKKITFTNYGDKKVNVTIVDKGHGPVTDDSNRYNFIFDPPAFTLDKKQSRTVNVTLASDKAAVDELTSIISVLATGPSAKSVHLYLIFHIHPDRIATKVQPKTIQLVQTMSSYVPLTIIKDIFPSAPESVGSPALARTQASFSKLFSVILFIDISGFTLLNERLAKLGSIGPEQVSRHLNNYFGQLIDAVNKHGGDVLKFAGDALICMFSNKSEEQEVLALRAIQCGMEIQSKLSSYDSNEGFVLTLHIGIGSGDIFSLYVGGIDGCWEFLVVGEPFLQLKSTVDNSHSGEVVISKETMTLVQKRVTGEPRGECDYVVRSIDNPVTTQEVEEVPITVSNADWMESCLRCYIPKGVQMRLDSHQVDWLAELRQVTVLFIKLSGLAYVKDLPLDFESINKVLCLMQEMIFSNEGMVRQFLVDDKGTVLIAAFGVPPLSHGDDPMRGLRTGMAVHEKLVEMGMSNSVGITTGGAFCGSVGSSKRQEYAMVGDIVNLSARLMGVADKLHVGVLCDQPTYEAASSSTKVKFEVLEPVMVKGKTNPIPIFRPYIQEKLTVDELKKLEENKKKPLVGRFAERKKVFSGILNFLQQKKGGVLIIEGVEGMGKSSFLNWISTSFNLAKGITDSFGLPVHVQVASAYADSFENNVDFHAWRQILSELLNLEKESGRNDCFRRLKVLQDLQGDDDFSWADYMPLLNDIYSDLKLNETTTTKKLSKKQRNMHIHNLIKLLVKLKSENSQLILIMDNGQWIDPASLALAYEVIKENDSIIFVVATRPILDPPHEYKMLCCLPDSQVIKLDRMRENDCLKIAADALRARVLPREMQAILYEANGNPLFAQELSFSFLESGFLKSTPQPSSPHNLLAVNKELTSVRIRSDPVTRVLSSRIDRLDASPQMVLKVASVIGLEFDKATLKEIYPLEKDRNRIKLYLRVLIKEDFVSKTNRRGCYKFTDRVTQRSAYTRLLFGQRQQLHQAVVNYYEQLLHLDVEEKSGKASPSKPLILVDSVTLSEFTASAMSSPPPPPKFYVLFVHHVYKIVENMKPNKTSNVKLIKKYFAYVERLITSEIQFQREGGEPRSSTQPSRTDIVIWIQKTRRFLENLAEFAEKTTLREEFEKLVEELKWSPSQFIEPRKVFVLYDDDIL